MLTSHSKHHSKHAGEELVLTHHILFVL